ncbi:hypothetical protein G6F22_011178 [Rhizopus arrhizus]|nr:hypothetical protein G6F22_011178 [Rhizopus arrhizus]
MPCQGDRPIAMLADTWPRAIDWMPARMISQKYAASNMVNVITAELNAPTRNGVGDPTTQAAMYGTRKQDLEARQPHHGQQRAQRQPHHRGQHGQRQGERHARLEQIGQGGPDHIEIEFTHGDPLATLAGRTDQPGNRDMAFKQAHAQHDNAVDDQVDHRRGGERLEDVEAEFLHGARLAGQLQQADGQRHRRILDGAHELRRQGRQHDAERLGQDDVAVHLHLGQPQRGARLELAARQRLDARTQLFGHACRPVETQAQHRGHELPPGLRHLLHRQAPRMRQQFGQHEIPEKHLHQQRHVAEDLHVRRAQHVHQPGLRRAHHAQPRSQQQRKDPRRQRPRQRPAAADPDRFQEGMHAVRRHLQENAPTPVVIHACALDRRRPRRLAPKPPRDAPGVPRTTCLLVCLGVARIRRVGQRTLQGVAHRILQVDLLGRDRRIEVLVIDRGDFAGLDQVQHGVGPLGALGRRHALGLQAQFDVLLGGQPRKQGKRLEHHRDARRRAIHRLAAVGYRALVAVDQAGHDAQQGGFARSGLA